ncbi:hypothetical protein HALA3H3_910003 [Halomonas sp. A3H3]|nr:hypothetical protein HALA3H3_910003 [Halomonas sp. A3H3]
MLVIDEGLFHHFRYEISDNWGKDKALFSKLMEKRFIVYMTARPEIIAERILMCYRKTGNLTCCHIIKINMNMKLLNIVEKLKKKKKSDRGNLRKEDYQC